MMTGWNDNTHMASGGWIWMAIVMVCVVAAVIVVGFMLLRNGTSDRGVTNGLPESASDVLARRYAAGELDDEEYERRRNKLLSR